MVLTELDRVAGVVSKWEILRFPFSRDLAVDTEEIHISGAFA